MILVNLAQAQSQDWDVIIAGSSFAAMFFRKALPPGLSVLIVEKGDIHSHQDVIKADSPTEETISQTDTSLRAKRWVAHTMFGGNSNCWWACTPRFHPNDFRMQSRYGVAEDWPFTYDSLAPYYQQVEDIMEISGGDSDHILPRIRPFPYPPMRPSRADRTLRARSRNWFAQPTARSNGGTRARCCANGICDRCPIDAKFTISNSEGLVPEEQPVLLRTDVRAVRVEGGIATGVSVRHQGRDAELNASMVALGTNGIFNAAILLRSGLDLPGIGVGLNEQVAQTVEVDAPNLGPFGGTSITGHGYDLYDGPHRATHSGVLMEVWNAPPSIRPEPGRWLDRVAIKLIVEDLPQEQNHVTLQADEPHITWKGHHQYAIDGLKWGLNQVANFLDAVEAVSPPINHPTEAHIIGTHRMGPDPARHVVDKNLRVHGVENLFALGSGAFPSSSMANPTLTLSAMSLIAGESVR